MWGAYFCVGAYKHDVVAEIKMAVYIHGVLILCGCLLSQFYSILIKTQLQELALNGCSHTTADPPACADKCSCLTCHGTPG